LPLLISRSAR